mmetsp:Transcript_29447/g.68264  ORF Transcript_29447/g.68264 Transcript_29447/m.68264 type:complete len:229 (-) Transcript_29447:68-754(-)
MEDDGSSGAREHLTFGAAAASGVEDDHSFACAYAAASLRNSKPVLKRRFSNDRNHNALSPPTGRRRGVVWDEENLTYNEEHKTATQKINEPKTPFNYAYYADPDPDLMDDGVAAGVKTPQSPARPEDMSAHFAQLHDAVLAHQEETGGRMSQSPQTHPHVMIMEVCPGQEADGEKTEEEIAKAKKFEAMRKQHYDMRAALQNRVVDSDEEDGAGSDGCEGGSAAMADR